AAADGEPEEARGELDAAPGALHPAARDVVALDRLLVLVGGLRDRLAQELEADLVEPGLGARGAELRGGEAEEEPGEDRDPEADARVAERRARARGGRRQRLGGELRRRDGAGRRRGGRDLTRDARRRRRRARRARMRRRVRTGP